MCVKIGWTYGGMGQDAEDRLLVVLARGRAGLSLPLVRARLTLNLVGGGHGARKEGTPLVQESQRDGEGLWHEITMLPAIYTSAAAAQPPAG